MEILFLKRVYWRRDMSRDPLQGYKEWLDKNDTGYSKTKWIYDWVRSGRITLMEFDELLRYALGVVV